MVKKKKVNKLTLMASVLEMATAAGLVLTSAGVFVFVIVGCKLFSNLQGSFCVLYLECLKLRNGGMLACCKAKLHAS